MSESPELREVPHFWGARGLDKDTLRSKQGRVNEDSYMLSTLLWTDRLRVLTKDFEWALGISNTSDMNFFLSLPAEFQGYGPWKVGLCESFL